MALLRRLRTILTGDGAERTLRYQCTACEETFDSTETHMAKVTCPFCSERQVVSVPGE